MMWHDYSMRKQDAVLRTSVRQLSNSNDNRREEVHFVVGVTFVISV